jgi:four helix bundle protein
MVGLVNGLVFAANGGVQSPGPRLVDDRAFDLLCDVIRFVRTIRGEYAVRRLVDQLVASAGSIAANRLEATGGSSQREFIRFNQIALRSANETALWLRAFAETGIGNPDRTRKLIDEARSIANILGAIIVRTKAKASRTGPSGL